MYKKFKQPQIKRARLNMQIRVSPIRLIDENGENLGVVETSEALKMAREKGLDLIEIAPNISPPVCKIMDHGKYQYQKSKDEKKQKSKQKRVEIKGVRIGIRTGKHDLETKAKQVEKFLNQGNKVKIDMMLRGREKGLFQLSKERLNDFIKMIPFEIKIEQEIKRQPRGLSMVIGKE